jgi:hypothetical protein
MRLKIVTFGDKNKIENNSGNGNKQHTQSPAQQNQENPLLLRIINIMPNDFLRLRHLNNFHLRYISSEVFLYFGGRQLLELLMHLFYLLLGVQGYYGFGGLEFVGLELFAELLDLGVQLFL